MQKLAINGLNYSSNNPTVYAAQAGAAAMSNRQPVYRRQRTAYPSQRAQGPVVQQQVPESAPQQKKIPSNYGAFAYNVLNFDAKQGREKFDTYANRLREMGTQYGVPEEKVNAVIQKASKRFEPKKPVAPVQTPRGNHEAMAWDPSKGYSFKGSTYEDITKAYDEERSRLDKIMASAPAEKRELYQKHYNDHMAKLNSSYADRTGPTANRVVQTPPVVQPAQRPTVSPRSQGPQRLNAGVVKQSSYSDIIATASTMSQRLRQLNDTAVNDLCYGGLDKKAAAGTASQGSIVGTATSPTSRYSSSSASTQQQANAARMRQQEAQMTTKVNPTTTTAPQTSGAATPSGTATPNAQDDPKKQSWLNWGWETATGNKTLMRGSANLTGQIIGGNLAWAPAAATGATIGSLICPGIGTTVGGIIGGVAGSMGGSAIGGAITEGAYDVVNGVRKGIGNGISGIYNWATGRNKQAMLLKAANFVLAQRKRERRQRLFKAGSATASNVQKKVPAPTSVVDIFGKNFDNSKYKVQPRIKPVMPENSRFANVQVRQDALNAQRQARENANLAERASGRITPDRPVVIPTPQGTSRYAIDYGYRL